MKLKLFKNKIPAELILMAVYLAFLAILASCNPVKQVLKDEAKYKEVTDKFVKDGGCVNDTTYVSDTTILLDTLYSLDFKTDTFYVDQIKTVVNTEYKTVTRTVTIKDTAVVTDRTKERLLEKRIADSSFKITILESDLKRTESKVSDLKKERNKWKFRFWLLVIIFAAITFRKPILKAVLKLIKP